MTEPGPAGWDWLGAATGPAGDGTLERAFAACFSGADGRQALAHLRRVFLDRRLPPSASDAELRHAEGQRSVAAYIAAMVDRGRR
ncbi:hypothetical protein SH611_03120 [Geminicoccaceae bacterium 1502E]|nr:hypothetical protein [Geminicoccaceae bacterium 1502E]